MKTKIILFALALGVIGFNACKNKHLIHDAEYLEMVEKKFEERKNLAVNRNTDLFAVFEKDLPINVSEALKFYFAYMPLCDLADYSGEFFLANVENSFKAREEMKWGKYIPEEIFLHYVLPIRVNNENLDSFRIAYYDEIITRVSNLSLEEAALEINHWCHEKVTYQPADIRTSSPLFTILSARGRCGEESTFTVAALRTAGIPARQVYTPRWAHSDDNHAWVEVWINGEWFYMGACEPEPVLDRGWFTEPARRTMLIHTKAFGKYRGNESLVKRSANYAEVNSLGKYASTKFLHVIVKDITGNPVKEANVEFQLYNYAEFYPLAVLVTDENGYCAFETGFGDLLIWGRKEDKFDFEKVSIVDYDTIFLELSNKSGIGNTLHFDFIAPVIKTPFPGISDEMIQANSVRLKEENRIRTGYIESWINDSQVKSLAKEIGANYTDVERSFNRSMGNYKQIELFLKEVPGDKIEEAIVLLDILVDKDLRDIQASVLLDHLLNADKYFNTKNEFDTLLYSHFVLNPRIANEIIKPWRSLIQGLQDDETIQAFRDDPEILVPWINNNIRIMDEENYYNVPISPEGVLELGIADKRSRDILFIACCRSCGIPSRLEPGTRLPQYYLSGSWRNIYFEGDKRPGVKFASVSLKDNGLTPVPEYYIHFTLARFENGRYNTLQYDYNKRINDFPDQLELPPGSYMMVTGSRVDDSKVLCSVDFFNLEEGEKHDLIVKPRNEPVEKPYLGSVNLQSTFKSNNKEFGIKEFLNNGMVISWIDPDKEPSKHILNDIPLLKSEFEQWGGYFIFLYDPENVIDSAPSDTFSELPENTLFGMDKNMAVFSSVFPEIDPSTASYPIVLYVDPNGNIVYKSEGYRIGIGEQIMKYIDR